MKAFIIAFFIAILVAFVIYMGGVVHNASFDLQNWTAGSREATGILGVCGFLLTLVTVGLAVALGITKYEP